MSPPRPYKQAMILRRWRQGYRLWAIAQECGVTRAHVVKVLLQAGVSLFAIERRSVNSVSPS